MRVVKMSGAGNDFLVLGPEESAALGTNLVDWTRRACRRRVSIGADGVLLVEPEGTDRVSVRFLNPDGSPAFCGNGSRCAARFAWLRGYAGSSMTLRTDVGEVCATVDGESVSLRLPAPRDGGVMTFDCGGDRLEGRSIDAGVPHVIAFATGPLADLPLDRWGPAVRHDERLGAAGANFDLVVTHEDARLALRTWERGVEGETLACGSGAIAAAFAWRLRGGPGSVEILPASGIPLRVELPGSPASPDAAILSGDARVIFEATVSAEATRGF